MNDVERERDEWKARALEAEDELEAWKEANLKPIEARARLQALEEAIQAIAPTSGQAQVEGGLRILTWAQGRIRALKES